jgi:hypothetical protein
MAGWQWREELLGKHDMADAMALLGVRFTPERERALAWRLKDGAGLEYCRHYLARPKDAEPLWFFEGTVISVEAGQPVSLIYRISFNEPTGRAGCSIQAHVGARENYRLELGRMNEATWLASAPGVGLREPVAALDGATDLDLEFTPLTNTLAIKRLDLAIGESADLVAAWVRFPKLTVEPLPQRYTRFSESIYRYESEGFSAEVEVDDLGFVVRYGDIWERVAVSDDSG